VSVFLSRSTQGFKVDLQEETIENIEGGKEKTNLTHNGKEEKTV